MKEKLLSVKQRLDDCISQLSEVSWMFSKRPGIYFTRERKLPFPKVISALLSMEGGSLTSEMLKYFGCSADIASASAFVQQRSKISKDTFPIPILPRKRGTAMPDSSTSPIFGTAARQVSSILIARISIGRRFGFGEQHRDVFRCLCGRILRKCGRIPGGAESIYKTVGSALLHSGWSTRAVLLLPGDGCCGFSGI